MLYFPPPNLEYTPNIDVDLGSIRTASTGSTDANQLFCNIAPGNIGDKIIVFVHAKYPSSTVLLAIENDPSGVNSLAPMGGTSYNPTYGQVGVRARISNGKEIRVRAYTEDQSKLSSIAILTVRIKGNHSPLVQDSYYSNTSTFAPSTIPSLTLGQKAFIPNYIYFTMLGKLEGTPYTLSDLPTVGISQNQLGVINTANTSMLISYGKSTDVTPSLNATWTDSSAVNRVAVITYIQAEQRAIGDVQGLNTSSVSHPSTNPHFLLIYPHFTKQASGYEEVYEFTFRAGNYTGTPDGVVEIGLYDITNGYTNAILCVSGSTNKIVRLSINKILITPYKLTAGRKYALGYRTSITNNAPSQNFLLYSSYAGNFALRRSTLTGSSALSSTWSDAGTTSDSRLAIGASVRYTKAAPSKILKTLPTVFTNSTRKPRNPKINWQNPITRGLAALYVPEDSRKNLVTNQVSTESTVTIGGFPEGLALLDSKLDFPFPPTRNGLRQQISVLFFGIVDPTGYEQLMTISDLTNTYNDILPLCRNSAINQSWQVQWMYGSRTTAASFSAPGFWENKVIAGAFARKRSGANQFHRFFKNGKFHSDGPTATAFSYTGVNNQFRFAGQQTAGNRVKRTYLIAIWDRDLTDAELVSVTKNPNQLLIKNNSFSYYIEVFSFAVDAVDDDNKIYNNQIVKIKGKDFGSVQGLVYIENIQQTIVSWKDTEIEITVSQGSLQFSQYTLRVYKPK